MDLVWHPGQARRPISANRRAVARRGERMHHFVLDFPYSNVGLVQLMPGENAECTCTALLATCSNGWAIMPERIIVFDNAAGVDQMVRARSAPDPPVPGLPRRITGSIVRSATRIPVMRRARWSPRSAWCGASCSCPGRRMEPRELQRRAAGPVHRLAWKPHYRKGHGGTACSTRTVRRCCRCPEAFRRGHVAAYEGRPVRRGHALEGFASLFRGPGERGQRVIVGLRALEVEVLDSSGQASGDPSSGVRPKPTNSEDPSMPVGAVVQQARVLA